MPPSRLAGNETALYSATYCLLHSNYLPRRYRDSNKQNVFAPLNTPSRHCDKRNRNQWKRCDSPKGMKIRTNINKSTHSDL